MKERFFLAVVVCLILLFIGQGSNAGGLFGVLERESRIELNSEKAKVFLTVENPSEEFSANVKLQVLAPNNYVSSKKEFTQIIKSGKQTLEIPLEIDAATRNNNSLLWYRLKYEIISTDGSNLKTEGIISFSQLFPEVFGLKLITSRGVKENNRFRFRVRAVNPANQKGVKDVLIESEFKVEDREEQMRPIKARAVTDSLGFAMLEFQTPAFKNYDDLELKITGTKNGLTRTLEDELSSFSLKQVNIQTDKPIYQPNQTVNLRLQYLNLDNLPVRDEEITIEIEDEEDEEVVFTEQAKSSRFGIASVAWKVPESAKLGNYQISVKDAEDEAIGYERIKITRYDLPNFYVNAKPEKPFYLTNETKAKIEIRADYLFGKPVAEARIRIAPRTVDDEDDDEKQKEITGKLDDEGKFTAVIDISQETKKFEPDNWRKFSDLRFSAFVTDLTTRKTEQKSFDIRITNEPIHVYLIGKTYNLSSRLPLKYFVSTFYADGTPASCEIGIYERIDEDRDGNKIPAEIGRTFAQTKTNSYGAGRFILPILIPADADEMPLKIIAYDKKGRMGSFEDEIEFDEKAAVRVETDKIAYRKGEAIKVSIRSSKNKGLVFVDIVKNFELLNSSQVNLENGTAEMVLPYEKDFQNSITIYTYFEDENEDLISDSKTVIFPTPDYLKIEAKTEKAAYRPGEEATIKFRSISGEKKAGEAALGILVLDKAIEERARSESEFGDENGFLNRTFVSRFLNLFGTQNVFGDLSLNDVKSLNPSKINPDLAIALEIALQNDNYEPNISRSDNLETIAEKVFARSFREKIDPVAAALGTYYDEKASFPTDEESLQKILSEKNIDFANMRDVWGNAFRPKFRYEKEKLILDIWSFGADKSADTADDLKVFTTNWKYFNSIGFTIDLAMRAYTDREQDFIKDYKTLRDELRWENIDLDDLRDAFGNPYKFDFSMERTNYVLNIKSTGKNVQDEQDDFIIWTSKTDYFTVARTNLIKGFNDYVNKTGSFPKNETQAKEILNKIGFDLEMQKKALGFSLYIQEIKQDVSANIYRYESPGYKIVRQVIKTFAVRSVGSDGIRGNFDDFDLARFNGAIVEEEVSSSDFYKNYSDGRRLFRQKIITTPQGAIGGFVIDQAGAVIPGATVSAKNNAGSFKRTVMSDDSGKFLFDNLPRGFYSLEVYAVGFKSSFITNLKIEPSLLIEIDVILEVGTVGVTVDVSSGAETINASNASISSTIIRGAEINPLVGKNLENFTPRIRNYFAETLVWSPELITDKKGKAELKFKFADSLTTWKLYAIGSTEDGQFGMVEKELQTFQPFFAELDPPKILTEGDEIALPVPIRNYTEKDQRVLVQMEKNVWSEMLNGSTQQIEVPSDSTKNAVFNFRAIAPVEKGKQKVSAIAKGEADAIEKNVTVKPNGREIISTNSAFFQNETKFEVNFPADAFPNTKRAEVKIYPNMFAHVAESVEGLLKRPYGCGEQTTSSTYPNLLILKTESDLGKSVSPDIKRQAEIYLADGYKRLLNYQTETGFGYWSGDNPDIALTAYVLRFLNDAEDFIEVDEEVVEKAESWLLGQQKSDGSWQTSKNTDISTAYVARSLSLTAGKSGAKRRSLEAAVTFLKNRLPEIKDDYVLANLGLIALEINDLETAKTVVAKLTENGNSFWDTNQTPFNGWGKTARIETTALVVQALLKVKRQKAKGKNEIQEQKIENSITKGIAFLLQNKDKFGVWYSTQTTVNVLDTLILIEKGKNAEAQNANEKVEIFVNGEKLQEFAVDEKQLSNPLILDVSSVLNETTNIIEIKGLHSAVLAFAQIVSKHYVDWSKDPGDENRYFNLDIGFDKTQAEIGEEITCRVDLQSKTNRSGMLLAEIGLPPGADVDRISLEKAKAEGDLSRYDILPDKVIVYLWTGGAGGTKFNFKFKPRYGINAQTAPSVVYDYYNSEAKATVAPLRFVVR